MLTFIKQYPLLLSVTGVAVNFATQIEPIVRVLGGIGAFIVAVITIVNLIKNKKK